MRILIVDHNSESVSLISAVLSAADMTCDVVATGHQALSRLEAIEYDAILMELDLVDAHGFDILRKLRAARHCSPVILMTGSEEPATQVSGLHAGADDMLVRPFDPREVVARLRAIVRRSRGIVQSVIKCGDIALDLQARSVKVRSRRLALTRTEYQILEMLFLRRGSPVTKRSLLDNLYGGENEPHSKIIDVFMCKVRKRIETISPGAANCIETVWGQGYAVREPQRADRQLA